MVSRPCKWRSSAGHAAALTSVSCRDQIREDWVLVRSDKVPSQEELLGEASGSEGNCGIKDKELLDLPPRTVYQAIGLRSRLDLWRLR